MTEQLKPEEKIERLELEKVKAGDIIEVVTGSDEEAWTYALLVEEAGQWPKGQLTATAPDGTLTEPVGFALHGAGNWTTRKQNPVQKQERGFTSYWDALYLRGYMVGKFDGQSDRAVFDQRGQEITEIKIVRAR